MVGPGLRAGAGLWGSVWDVSFFPSSIHLLPKPSPVNSHSSFLAFNRPPLHLCGFGAEKASPRLCVDVCHGPKGCPGPRLSSATSPLPGDHGPCWSVPQGLLPGSFGDSCPVGDLRALCEQGKAREMERTTGVPSGTPGSGPVGPQLSRPALPLRLLVRNLVRLVLLWAWPNPAQGQQLALGANCCTALAHPVMCAGGAARPGLVPATNRLLAHGTETDLSLGWGQSLGLVRPGVSDGAGKGAGRSEEVAGSAWAPPAALSLAARRWAAACVSPVVGK